MDATQQIEDSFFGEEEEEEGDSDDEHEKGKRQTEPLAVLKVFKNNHIPETEVPLYQGENVLGRDPTSCAVPLQARSISGRHAIISISVFGPDDRHAHRKATEALLWDLGSLNGTRKGLLKLTPHVRYALTEGDSVVLADLPCQYISLKNTDRSMHTATAEGGKEKAKGLPCTSSSSECGTAKGVENGGKKSVLPPVPVRTDEVKSLQSPQTTSRKSERTLVPESDSDSDGEKHRRKKKRRILDSSSSELSSPTCSTFLTPANKVIPESEDEHSITPSPALKGGFLKTGNDTGVSSDSSKPDPLYFNIDSDTDNEDEVVHLVKVTPGINAAVTAEVDAVNPADLHMDSDTDVEDEEMEKSKCDPEALGAPAKQDLVNPASLSMDSGTDVEENEPVKTDTIPLSGPEAALGEKKEATSSAQFHFDSDTDVEDEDASRIQDSRPPTSHIAELNMNSDTDVEEDEEATKATEPPSGSEVDSKDLVKQAKSVDSVRVPDAKMLHHQSDSDTDVEDDVTEIRTPAVARVTEKSQTPSQIQIADEGSTDAQQASRVQVQPPAETVRDGFRLDSDTEVEEDEEKMEEKEKKCAEAAVKIVHSSTPIGAGLSEEEMETQAFLSPSQLFKRPVLPSLLHPLVSPGGISHTDHDFAVAETQSFVCDAAQAEAMLDETPQSLEGPESHRSVGASSFKLGLSDSSHQVPEAEEHDGEPADEDWQLQATQLYAMKNSEGSTKAGQTYADLDTTQAYTDWIGQEEEEDGGKEEEKQPLAALGHSSIHTAETQLIKHTAQDKDDRDHDANEEVVASEPEIKAEEEDDNEMQVDSHLSTADTLLIIRSPRQEAQTLPYAFLTAQIQKEQEETEEEEHESSDQGVQETDEGEKIQNEMNEHVGNENDKEEGKSEQIVMEKNDDITRDGPEEEKTKRDESKRVENDNVDEVQEEGKEEEEDKHGNSRRPGRRRQTAKVEPEQPVEYGKVTRVTICETQPVDEEEEGQEEEQLNKPSSSTGTQSAEAESTQPLESEDHTQVGITKTLPMGEEEEGQEEEENKPRSYRRPGRRRQTAKVEPKQPVKSDKVTCVPIPETQNMCGEDKDGQEEEQQTEAMSTKGSSKRRPAKPVEFHVTIPVTLPICEEEGQEEKPQNEAKSIRKSRRGRQTAKIESTQSLEPDSTAETMKLEEAEEEQDSRRSLRVKERGRAASVRGKGRGRAASEKGKRGKVEQEEDSEEEVHHGNNGKGRKNLRQKSKDDDKAKLEPVEAENEEPKYLQEEEGKRLRREKEEEDARLERKRKEREESIRLEKEREEREACEKREQEEKNRLERERIEREKKEREEKEKKEREEMKRLESEKQLEKERREQEERTRVEQERIEKEKEKLEKEMRERQVLEEQLEKERKNQEEKDRLEREKRDREEKEQLEKEMREEKEKQEKEMEQKESQRESKDSVKKKRQAPGKQKTGQGRKGKGGKKEEEQELEEGTKERLETEQELSDKQKQECEAEGRSKKQEDTVAESEVVSRRGRRTTRKSVAPPPDVEDEGGPAKRTRSRSNSSNSVCSEQSTQDSLSEGRRRGGQRKTAEEVIERGRPSGRRRTTTVPSSVKEDIKQAAHSRSNSRSSDRSSSSLASQSQGRGGKRRNGVKAEEPEEKDEEGEQSAAVGRGRGRGRGGKRPGANDIKAEPTGEAKEEEAEVMAVAKDNVTSQSSSRGRKRGADISLPMAETFQPTPKTPRRSLAGQTHKVLFTGVVDEEGEKVLVRLGGGLAKGVGDMSHLVTDKVRRTVKFLCAVARGVPIVTPEWLSKCGKAGRFLSPNGFFVKDVEQEKRFNFSLREALRVASSQPLLQGYEIHVTPSVKPEPAQMKEIITCCGARFLPKMPSAHKAQTVVVVSCEEDRALCERARRLSFPVVTAEFLLTGILQQKVDLETHALSRSPTAAAPKPAARSRGK